MSADPNPDCRQHLKSSVLNPDLGHRSEQPQSEAKVYVNTPDCKFDTDIGVSNINATLVCTTKAKPEPE